MPPSARDEDSLSLLLDKNYLVEVVAVFLFNLREDVYEVIYCLIFVV
jgi:hypothetical protein